MTRYVSRPRACDWDEPGMFVGTTVYDDGPSDTGLLDARGHPIYRMRDPIGFRFGDGS